MILYFQVHQPRRLRTLRFFDIGANSGYFDDELNKDILQRIASECYLPANALLLKLIKKNPAIRVAFSISGIAIDQLEEYAPEVLDSFRLLAETGSVDFLTETYYHSLACLAPGNEFELQVVKHRKKILQHFGILSNVFRNTELIHSQETADRISKLGFKGVMIDGVDRVLEGRSCHHLYAHPGSDLKLFLRDFRLSDDIAFRFSQDQKTLTATDYLNWLEQIPAHEQVINIAMDYETFGEHQKRQSGIFDFLEGFLKGVGKKKHFRLLTPSEATDLLQVKEKLPVVGYISWADHDRDLSAWLGNEMQRDAFDSVIKLEHDVKMLHDRTLLNEWRTLLTSDHFYYMSTKKGSDGEVHSYFSPYPSPYEAFINYMNVLSDFALRVKIVKSAGKLGQGSKSQLLPEELEVSMDVS